MPNRTPDDQTIEGIAHDHGDGDAHHIHRLGDLPHIHSDGGKAVLLDKDAQPLFDGGGQEPTNRRRDVATGRFLSKIEVRRLHAEATTITLRRPDLIAVDGLLADFDQRLAFLDDLADRAIDGIRLEPDLVALAAAQFDHEVAQLEAAADRLEAEIDGRGQFLDFADAAQAIGHHPATAYCYAADRFDPVVNGGGS